MRSARLFLFAVGVLACQQTALAPMPTPASTLSVAASTDVTLPDTRAGRLARALLAALDSADEAALLAFLERTTPPATRATHPLAVALPLWLRLAEQSGGLDVVEVEPLDDGLRVATRARRVARRVDFRIVPEAQGPFAAIDVDIYDEAERDDPGKLPRVAMSEAELSAAIARRVEQLGAADRFSGVVLVLHGERALVRAAQGHAERAFAAPNRHDTKFNLGSMNKMFTALAIAQLVEQGKLSFDDTVLAVLPDYPDRAFAEAAKIHHLLTHTSGIGGDIFDERMYAHRDRFKVAADYLLLIVDKPRATRPGDAFAYANSGFVVLGLVIERVSGESYDDYLARHVFAPAGMPDTAAYAWNEVVPNLAVGYDHEPGDVLRIGPRRTNVEHLPYRGTPAGGGYSTAPDLQAFAAALRGHRLLGAAMTETLTGPKVDFAAGGRYGYGFISYAIPGRDVRGHSGGHVGINAALQMFWDGSYTVIVLANVGSGAAPLAEEITGLLAAQPAS